MMSYGCEFFLCTMNKTILCSLALLHCIIWYCLLCIIWRNRNLISKLVGVFRIDWKAISICFTTEMECWFWNLKFILVRMTISFMWMSVLWVYWDIEMIQASERFRLGFVRANTWFPLKFSSQFYLKFNSRLSKILKNLLLSIAKLCFFFKNYWSKAGKSLSFYTNS